METLLVSLVVLAALTALAVALALVLLLKLARAARLVLESVLGVEGENDGLALELLDRINSTRVAAGVAREAAEKARAELGLTRQVLGESIRDAQQAIVKTTLDAVQATIDARAAVLTGLGRSERFIADYTQGQIASLEGRLLENFLVVRRAQEVAATELYALSDSVTAHQPRPDLMEVTHRMPGEDSKALVIAFPADHLGSVASIEGGEGSHINFGGREPIIVLEGREEIMRRWRDAVGAYYSSDPLDGDDPLGGDSIIDDGGPEEPAASSTEAAEEIPA